jgi:hypothetical protein
MHEWNIIIKISKTFHDHKRVGSRQVLTCAYMLHKHEHDEFIRNNMQRLTYLLEQ